MQLIIKTKNGEHLEINTNSMSIVENRLKCQFITGSNNTDKYVTPNEPKQFVINQNNISQLLIHTL